MSLNLVRIALNVKTLQNKVSMGLVTDFTGTSPILEAWGAYAFSKNAKIIFGQLQTHAQLGGTWSPALASGTGVLNPAVDSAGTYTYTVGGGLCSSDSATVLVTIAYRD